MPRTSTVLLIVCLVGGCSSGDPDRALAARQALDGAEAAMADDDLNRATTLLTAAIESGDLPPDELAGALIDRAICLARFDMFDLAHKDLDNAATGAPPERIHVARSFVYAEEGKTAEAEAELQNARAIDPSAERIAD